ncbi:MAG: TonB-dependent receptor, partial [Aquificota bacterium]
MKRALLLGAILSFPAFSQELLLKEVEVKGKKETFKDSLEIREVRESFAKDVGEALQKLDGIHKVRKAGIANDVVIRAFQRDNINVLIDESEVHGACPNRMDPPAFHVDFSEVETIEVIKGPFDIRHQGSLGGLVNIVTRKPEMGFRLRLNATLGSFDFRSFSPVVSYRDERFYGLAGYSYRYSKPYKDGDGKRITEYANYRPQYINSKAFEINTYWTKFGFKPLENHEVELGYTRQDARHVLYPALMMDAIYDKTDRFNFKYSIGKVSDLLKSLEFQFYYTKVDHWMDNRYRTFMGTPSGPYSMATDAKTKTYGGRLEAKVADFTLGMEAYRRNWDAVNYMWNQMAGNYGRQFIIPDADITNFGVYGEYRKSFSPKLRVIAGLRIDSTKSEADSSKANTNLYYAYHNTRSTSKTDTYPSGNLQLFYNLTPELELFTGLGYAVRVPDQQERYFALNRAMMCNPPQNTYCAWVGNPELKPSKNLELDVGLKHQTQRSLTKATIFVSYVQDYITVNNKPVVNPIPMVAPAGGRAMTYANTDARFWGFELSSTYNLWNNLFLLGGASYVEGRKDRKPAIGITDRDVAEVPPLRGRLGLRYDTG